MTNKRVTDNHKQEDLPSSAICLRPQGEGRSFINFEKGITRLFFSLKDLSHRSTKFALRNWLSIRISWFNQYSLQGCIYRLFTSQSLQEYNSQSCHNPSLSPNTSCSSPFDFLSCCWSELHHYPCFTRNCNLDPCRDTVLYQANSKTCHELH